MNLIALSDKIQAFLEETADAVKRLEVDPEQFQKALDIIVACRGKIITTGLGKAGHVAQKSASSFCSMGFPAVFLHPAEAAHGDSGLLSKEDVVIAFSTSGKTREVLETLAFAKDRVSSVIAVTSHKDATVKKLADVVLDMGDIEEAGYLQLAPTTSIIIMLIFSDLLGTIGAEIKGFKSEDFAKYHHGGYLGAKARGENTSSSSSF